MHYHVEFFPRFVVVGLYSLYWLPFPLAVLSRGFTSDLGFLLVILVSYRWESFLWCKENIQKDVRCEAETGGEGTLSAFMTDLTFWESWVVFFFFFIY